MEQVLELVNKNIPYRTIEKELDVPRSTIGNWKKKAKSKDSCPTSKNGTEKQSS